MEDDGLTQKSTQLQSDPRRHGVNSMLSEDDECDVLCILHPGSPAAYQAVALNVERTPQHILQNQGLSHNLDDMDGSKLDYDDDPDNPGQNQHSASEYRDDMLGHGGTATNEGRGIDIALRLSSQIQNPSMGFTFGRRPQKCDLLLSKWEQYDRKISGMHFRIYLNKSGVLMVEDTSTNGTIVDSVVLTRHNNALGVESRRMISPGSIIEVLLHSKNTKKNTRELEVLKFIVSIPSRDHVGDRWGQNLAKYLAWLDQTDRQATILAQAAAKGQALALPPVSQKPLILILVLHMLNRSRFR